MDNQHKLIQGYRDFPQQTVERINAVKAAEIEIGLLYQQLKQVDGIDQRSLALAKTKLQEGFSWMVRSIAQPADPFEPKQE